MITALRRIVREGLARVWPGGKVSETPGVLWSAPQSSAGVPVNETDALSLSGVFAAVSLLSRVIGSLPLKVYRRDGVRGRQEATTNPASYVLGTSANPEMTAAVYKRTMEFHRCLWGNAYAEVGWAGSGAAKALWPVEPWRVRPRRKAGGALYYEVDGTREVAPGDMIHQTLMSFDGVCGRSWVDFALDSLGLSLAQQTHAGAYFGNGARPGVILEHPGQLTEEQMRKMRKTWNERHQGAARGGGTAVLWGGWKFVGTDGQVDPEKSQLLEQRRFGVEETARWLGIPPHLLRDLSRATFSNIEHQAIDFVVYSIGPTLVEVEQEYDRKLLDPPDLYCKHNVAALLRGDSAARSAFYRELWGIGVLSVNEIRELEDRNPIDGGDTYFVPANMMTLEDAIDPPDPAPAPAPPGGTPQPDPAEPPDPADPPDPPDPAPDPTPAMRVLLSDTLARLARVEANALRRAAERPGKFLDWLEEFYPGHQARLAEALGPVLAACAGVGARAEGDAATVAADWCRDSRESLLALSGEVGPGDLPPRCAALADGWETAAPLGVAERVLPGGELCRG